jgi:hypothetical protein
MTEKSTTKLLLEVGRGRFDVIREMTDHLQKLSREPYDGDKGRPEASEEPVSKNKN